MSTSTELETVVPPQQEPKAKRLGTILRWAARITSIPIFGLLMISLVPAVTSFRISPKDDQIIALGMCGTAVGFVLAWRWAGIGGALAALGVGAMLAECDGSIFADPFSVAFGMQAILFLISWAVNSPSRRTAAPQINWVKRAAVCLLVISAVAGAVVIYRGPGPTRLPKEKEWYAGVWDNGKGFRMEITVDGRASISQDKDAKVELCNTPLPAGGNGEYLVNFRGDDRLELTSGVLESPKVYHIDRRPSPKGKPIKMVLNGSDPYKQSSGMSLVRKDTAGTNATAKAGDSSAPEPTAKKPAPQGGKS